MTMDDDDRRLLHDSLAQTVAAAPPEGLRAALTEFGWPDLLAEDPAVAVSSLATLQGEHLTGTSLLDDVVLAAAGMSGPVGVVYPDLPHSQPTSQLTGMTLTVSGVLSGEDRERYVVPALQDGQVVLVTTALPGPEPARGLDPSSGWRRRRLEVPVEPSDIVTGPAAGARWATMRAAGQRALAHELTAIGGRMLASALEHVKTREQFGRPLGSFQAVQHALADVRVWFECAQLAAEAAWEDDRPEAAELAKILSGRLFRTAAANCQQVLGGMGFTWEHEFHRYLRRGLVLEPLLGSAAHLRVVLGSRVRTTGVPQLAQL
jgi:hypothetical protein